MESERLERYKQTCGHSENHEDALAYDEKLAKRILLFLNDDRLDEFSLLDAYYFDYSILPKSVRGKFCRDMYFIFGITDQAEIISKWVERWDLDSDYQIINGQLLKRKDNQR